MKTFNQENLTANCNKMFVTKLYILFNCLVLCKCNLSILNGPIDPDRSSIQTSKCITKFLTIDMHIPSNKIHPRQSIQIDLNSNQSSELEELVLGNLFYRENDVERAFVIRNFKNDRTIPQNYHSKPAKYILFAYNRGNVEENILAWKSSQAWNPLALVFVVLQEYPIMTDANKTVEEILTIFHEHDMWKCYVIVTALQEGFVDLFSWFPYEENFCSNSIKRYEILDRCFLVSNATNNKSKLASKIDEWQSKWTLNNLNQCPIKVSAWIGRFFAVKVIPSSGEEIYSGLDIYLMRIVATKLNFSLKVTPNPYDRAEYNENLQMRNFQRVLLEGSDILIGGISRRLTNPKFLATTDTAHSSDYVTWCVKALTIEGDWKNLFFTFSKPLWIIVIVFTIFIALPIYHYLFTEKFRSNYILSMMYSLQITIGFASDYSPKKLAGKVLLVVFLFYGLILSSLFQSASVKSMTNYYHRKQITSIQEALDRKFTFVGANTTHAVLLYTNDEVSNLKKYFVFIHLK